MTTATRTPPHHNNLTCYTDYDCRLPACEARARAYEAARRASRAAGTWQPLLDAEPVRQHLLALRDAGLTTYRIAVLAGLEDNTVRGFLTQTRAGQRINGRRKRTTPEVAAKILAVDPATAAPAKAPSIGSLRRLQALTAIGWSRQAISRQTGISDQTLYNVGRTKVILRTTAEAVTAAYDELKTKRPGRRLVSLQQYNAARNRAASHRWPPPSYWNDPEHPIDDPAFEPQYGITRIDIIGAEAGWLIDGGVSRDDVAARLGVTRGYVDKALTHVQRGEAA